MYSLYFKVEIGPFEIKRLALQPVAKTKIPEEMAKIEVLNYQPSSRSIGPIRSSEFHVDEEEASKKDFVLSNDCLAASFQGATSGHLNRVAKANPETSVNARSDFIAKMEFMYYNSDNSGAYLFLPDGEAMGIGRPIKTILVSGPIQTSVLNIYWYVEQIVTMFGGRKNNNNNNNAPPPSADEVLLNTPLSSSTCDSSSLFESLQLTNRVSLQNAVPNNELIMRIRTNIKSGDLFYTDSNAFEMVKRKRFPKLPIQVNFVSTGGIFLVRKSVHKTFIELV